MNVPGKPLSEQGVHRKKREVDAFWFKQQLNALKLTLPSFGEALARETRRATPLDKASLSRRLSGRIPFTTQEAEALSRIFGLSYETILSKIGGSTSDPPVVGVVDDTGDASLSIDSTESFQKLRLKTSDGWDGAALTIRGAPIGAANAPRGVYLVALNDRHALRQFLGVVAGNALLAPPFGAGTIESLPVDDIRGLRAVLKIEL